MRPQLSESDSQVYRAWLGRMLAFYVAISALVIGGMAWNLASHSTTIQADAGGASNPGSRTPVIP